MLRKIVFTICLITILITASASIPAIDQSKLPGFENVFSLPIPEGGWIGAAGHFVQFKSAMYLNTSGSSGVGIYRSFDGASWSLVNDGNYGLDPIYQWGWDATVFKGKLYVSALCFWVGDGSCPGSLLLRSSNGTDWEKIPLDSASYMLDKIGEFDGMLYATTVYGSDPNSGGHILRSENGDAGTWTVVQDLDPWTTSSSSPTVYNDRVYISGYAEDGYHVIIWSSSDGLNWETKYLPVTETSGNWLRDGKLIAYRDALYLSTLNWNDGGAIYRTTDGKNWLPVFQISPSETYYDIAVEDMIQFESTLYAAVIWTDPSTGLAGTQIWSSATGDPNTWVKISSDGSLDWVWPERGAFGVFKSQLYLSDTGNWAPPAVYRMDGH